MKYIFGYFLRGIFICFLLLVSFGISHANGHAGSLASAKNNGACANAKKELETMKISFTKKEFLIGVKENNLPVVKLFLCAGMNPNASDAKTGDTALIYASLNGNVQIVRLLLSYNVNINAKSNNGFTAMAAAVFSGHAKVMNLLKKAGAKTNSSQK